MGVIERYGEWGIFHTGQHPLVQDIQFVEYQLGLYIVWNVDCVFDDYQPVVRAEKHMSLTGLDTGRSVESLI